MNKETRDCFYEIQLHTYGDDVEFEIIGRHTHRFKCKKLDIPNIVEGFASLLKPWPSEIAEKKRQQRGETEALIVGGLFLALVIAVWSFN